MVYSLYQITQKKHTIIRLHPMVEYLEAAEKMVHNEGAARNIFLTTDDGELIEDLTTGRYASFNFTFFYTRYCPF